MIYIPTPRRAYRVAHISHTAGVYRKSFWDLYRGTAHCEVLPSALGPSPSSLNYFGIRLSTDHCPLRPTAARPYARRKVLINKMTPVPRWYGGLFRKSEY